MRSKTLTDFLNRKELPRIFCGIARTEREEKELEKLQESFDLSKSEHFPLMLPHKDDFPSKDGYQYRSHGVWLAPDLSHIMYKSAKKEVRMRPDEYEKMNALAVDVGHSFDKDVGDATKKLAPEYGMYDGSHKAAIKQYQGNSMDDINHKLTKGTSLSKEHRAKVDTLDEACHLHQTPHSFAVYSGIDPEHAAKVILHDQVHHPAFLSTSLSPHVAAGFAQFKADENNPRGVEGHILKIVVPNHHAGAFVGHLHGMNEHEFILPRDTVLNIHRDKTLYAPIPHSDGKSFFTIHHATIEKKK